MKYKKIVLFIVVSVLFATNMTSFAAHGENILRPGEKLERGQWLESENKQYMLYMSDSGDLRLCEVGASLLWRTKTKHTMYKVVQYASMQYDGNFVIYSKDRYQAPPPVPQNKYYPVWNSKTDGNAGAYLVIQNDGNLVIYLNGIPLWATNTCR